MLVTAKEKTHTEIHMSVNKRATPFLWLFRDSLSMWFQHDASTTSRRRKRVARKKKRRAKFSREVNKSPFADVEVRNNNTTRASTIREVNRDFYIVGPSFSSDAGEKCMQQQQNIEYAVALLHIIILFMWWFACYYSHCILFAVSFSLFTCSIDEIHSRNEIILTFWITTIHKWCTFNPAPKVVLRNPLFTVVKTYVSVYISTI